MTEKKCPRPAIKRCPVTVIGGKIKITSAETVESKPDIRSGRSNMKLAGKIQSPGMIAHARQFKEFNFDTFGILRCIPLPGINSHIPAAAGKLKRDIMHIHLKSAAGKIFEYAQRYFQREFSPFVLRILSNNARVIRMTVNPA